MCWRPANTKAGAVPDGRRGGAEGRAPPAPHVGLSAAPRYCLRWLVRAALGVAGLRLGLGVRVGVRVRIGVKDVVDAAGSVLRLGDTAAPSPFF